jgi:TPR repeat protein
VKKFFLSALGMLAFALCFSPTSKVAAQTPQTPAPASAEDVARLSADCDQKKYESCTALGQIYMYGAGVAKDYARATGLFQRACDGGYVDGCTKLGNAYWGSGVFKDKYLATDLYQKTCNAGNAEGCFGLGLSYREGYGVLKNFAAAAQSFRKACKGGFAIGCSTLAGWIVLDSSQSSSDISEAIELYKRACDLQLKSACEAWQPLMKTLVEMKAEFVRVNSECEQKNFNSCNRLGQMYSSGFGVPKDAKSAVAAYQKSCDGGVTFACDYLAGAYEYGDGVAKDEAKAESIYRKTCDSGRYSACTHVEGLAQKYDTDYGSSRAHAVELYQQACDHGSRTSCNRLMKLGALPTSGRYPLAIVEAARTCNQGGTGRIGFNAQLNCEAVAAFTRLQELCFSGNAQACAGIANNAARDKDYKAAATYYAWACGRGDKKSCGRAEDSKKKIQ